VHGTNVKKNIISKLAAGCTIQPCWPHAARRSKVVLSCYRQSRNYCNVKETELFVLHQDGPSFLSRQAKSTASNGVKFLGVSIPIKG
jgi:hypothetical protein